MQKAARLLKENNEEIIQKWEKKVKSEIKASQKTSSLALRNQLPHILEDIAEILEKYDDFEHVEEDEEYKEIIKNSLDHGRHRATTTNYTVAEILKEYIVLHQVLTDTLMKANAYNESTSSILKYTLETAMIKSASSFTDAINHMKEKLVGTLAHDIRNPISNAFLALDILNPEDSPETIEETKKMAVNSLNYSLKLIEGLLDAISVEAGEGITLNFEKANICKDIQWVVHEAKLMFTPEIILTSNSSSIIGVFDGTAIRRMLENLVTNAVKYGDQTHPIQVDVHEFENSFNLSVHNTGNPIAEEKQAEIFNYLEQGKSYNGDGIRSWGIGLSLVKAVTEAHGGEVELTSTKKQGTTFKIKIEKFKNKPGKVKSLITYK